MIPQRNLVRQTQTSATLSLKALLSCASVCVLCKPALTFLHWRSHPLLRSKDGCRDTRWLQHVEKQSAWREWPYCRLWGSGPGTLPYFYAITWLSLVPSTYGAKWGVNVVERSQIGILGLQYKRKFPKKVLVHGRKGQKWFIFISGSLRKAKGGARWRSA